MQRESQGRERWDGMGWGAVPCCTVLYCTSSTPYSVEYRTWVGGARPSLAASTPSVYEPIHVVCVNLLPCWQHQRSSSHRPINPFHIVSIDPPPPSIHPGCPHQPSSLGRPMHPCSQHHNHPPSLHPSMLSAPTSSLLPPPSIYAGNINPPPSAHPPIHIVRINPPPSIHPFMLSPSCCRHHVVAIMLSPSTSSLRPPINPSILSASTLPLLPPSTPSMLAACISHLACSAQTSVRKLRER